MELAQVPLFVFVNLHSLRMTRFNTECLVKRTDLNAAVRRTMEASHMMQSTLDFKVGKGRHTHGDRRNLTDV